MEKAYITISVQTEFEVHQPEKYLQWTVSKIGSICFNKGMYDHSFDERNQLMDWFIAKQLIKNKKLVTLIESWEDSPSALQRRAFCIIRRV